MSVIEAHGNYSPVTELATNSRSEIKELKVLLDTEDYTAITITTVNDKTKFFITANQDASKEAKHTVSINGTSYNWTGTYYFK